MCSSRQTKFHRIEHEAVDPCADPLGYTSSPWGQTGLKICEMLPRLISPSSSRSVSSWSMTSLVDTIGLSTRQCPSVWDLGSRSDQVARAGRRFAEVHALWNLIPRWLLETDLFH